MQTRGRLAGRHHARGLPRTYNATGCLAQAENGTMLPREGNTYSTSWRVRLAARVGRHRAQRMNVSRPKMVGPALGPARAGSGGGATPGTASSQRQGQRDHWQHLDPHRSVTAWHLLAWVDRTKKRGSPRKSREMPEAGSSSQAEGRGFDPRLPLQRFTSEIKRSRGCDDLRRGPMSADPVARSPSRPGRGSRGRRLTSSGRSATVRPEWSSA
jgi:hypothetical protein